MNNSITASEYTYAERKMQNILKLVTKKGGFDFLSTKETIELKNYTSVVKKYEEKNILIPFPETLEGILELKMYENKLKQKELAKILNTSDTQLSEIINKKRKPSLSFLKSLHQVLGVDGNLLLKLA